MPMLTVRVPGGKLARSADASDVAVDSEAGIRLNGEGRVIEGHVAIIRNLDQPAALKVEISIPGRAAAVDGKLRPKC